ncbi:recombinase family protein [Sutcliffiella horikoshii]|uniref:recombinase family protein n=1 Tax=Sutcliffiella horikoshii TaxID=79883 RepID=UPI0038513F12
MKIGYARVSTQDQNLDMQVDALEKAGCDKVYTEKMSGTRDDRPELTRILRDVLRHGDTLVVYKMDRLGRSTFRLLELTQQLEEDGIEFESIQDRIDTSTPIGKAMFRMLAVLAEMERDIIVERTQAGLQAARARGRVGGRPSTPKKAVEKALKLYNSKEYSIAEIVELTNVSKATIYRELKKRNS